MTTMAPDDQARCGRAVPRPCRRRCRALAGLGWPNRHSAVRAVRLGTFPSEVWVIPRPRSSTEDPVHGEHQTGVGQGDDGEHDAHRAGIAELALGERGGEQLLGHDKSRVVGPPPGSRAAM